MATVSTTYVEETIAGLWDMYTEQVQQQKDKVLGFYTFITWFCKEITHAHIKLLNTATEGQIKKIIIIYNYLLREYSEFTYNLRSYHVVLSSLHLVLQDSPYGQKLMKNCDHCDMTLCVAPDFASSLASIKSLSDSRDEYTSTPQHDIYPTVFRYMVATNMCATPGYQGTPIPIPQRYTIKDILTPDEANKLKNNLISRLSKSSISEDKETRKK